MRNSATPPNADRAIAAARASLARSGWATRLAVVIRSRLLGPDGPVVIDFGLAAVPGMTTTGLSGQVAVGTPAFMSPEQLSGARVTAAADMWAWAVTIAFAGTGELPFRGESLTATAYAIIHSEPIVGPIPEPLGSIIHRCLSKNPAFRPSAHGALTQLVAAGAQAEGPLPPEPPAVPIDEEAYAAPPAPAMVPEPLQGSNGGPPSARPAAAESPAAQRGGGRRWRWAAAIAVPVLLVAGVIGVAVNLASHGTPPARPTGRLAGTNPQHNPEAVARSQAITWIMHQASRSAVVSCDAQVCTDLSKRGFPNLLTLGPQSNDPLGSDLVVATAAIRAQFHNRLASVYAPIVIAAFGSGNARIEIREVFPEGTAEYRAVAQPDARARKNADAQLLTNNSFTFSPEARAQLRSGQVDPRLPKLLAILVHSHPLWVVDFGGRSPGGGPASLLRSVDLAATNPAAHLSGAAYFSWIHRFVKAQRAQFRPTLSQVRLPSRQAVLRIGFGAPSPLR